MVRRLERLPELAVDDLGLPDMVLLLATDIAAVDHHEGTITLIANAVNWNGTDERVDEAYDDAVARLDVMTAALGQPLSSTVATFSRPVPEHRAQRTVEEYTAIVEKLVGDIEAGEAFQVVPSQRFEMDTGADPIDVYRMLRVTNPSPYMYLLNVPNTDGGLDFSVVGSSPEALVTVKDGRATTHPIAGTRWRGSTEEEDVLLEKELLADEKERAEHLMLVDLGRNDLGAGVPPGHGPGRGLQPHRAVQPRHASGVHGHRRVGRGQDRVGRGDGVFPGGHPVGGAEGSGHGVDRGGREDPAGSVRRGPGVPGFRRQRRLRHRHPYRADARRHGIRAGRRGSGGRFQRSLRVQRVGQQGQGRPQRHRCRRHIGRAVTRAAQALFVVAAVVLWVASRMTWVEVSSFDGLGQPKTTTLSGASWSTALIPLALLVLAAAVAVLAVRGWTLRLLALLIAVASAGMGYLGISLWVIKDVAVRAADLAVVPLAQLTGTSRSYGGAVLTLIAALCALAGAVMLMRSANGAKRGVAGRYAAPAARREAVKSDNSGEPMSERMLWDALDEGQDPTGDGGDRRQ